jgi:hypothetical protein
MTHEDFFPFHNRHIRFLMGGRLLSGVVVDDQFHTEGKSKRSHYSFIPTANIKNWHEAQSKHDRNAMYALTDVIDIKGILAAEVVLYRSSRT